MLEKATKIVDINQLSEATPNEIVVALVTQIIQFSLNKSKPIHVSPYFCRDYLQPVMTTHGRSFFLGTSGNKNCYWFEDLEGVYYYDEASNLRSHQTEYSIEKTIEFTNKMTPLIDRANIIYPEKLKLELEKIFKIDINELSAVLNLDDSSILKNICALKYDPNPYYAIVFINHLTQLFMDQPSLFLEHVNKLLSTIQNAQVNNQHTYNIERANDALFYLINIIKNVYFEFKSKIGSKLYKEIYQQLAFKIGEFIYLNASDSGAKGSGKEEINDIETDNNNYKIALLCFILAGDYDGAPKLKNACYLALFKEKGLPDTADLAKMAKNNPKILANLLTDNFFSDSLNTVRVTNNNAAIEEIKLNCLLEMTINSLEPDSYEANNSKARSLLLAAIDRNGRNTEVFLPLINSYFKNDLKLYLDLAYYAASGEEKIFYLQTASKLLKNVDLNNISRSNQLLFMKIAHDIELKNDEIRQTAKTLILASIEANDSAFINAANNSARFSIAHAKLLLEISKLTNYENFLLFAFHHIDECYKADYLINNNKFSHIERYQYYQLKKRFSEVDYELLMELAKEGNEEALTELKQLASQKEYKEYPLGTLRACLGDIYLKKAETTQDFDLAAKYYSMEPCTPDSIFRVCELAFQDRLSGRIKLLRLMSCLIEMSIDEELLDTAIILTNEFLSKLEYHDEALATIVQLYIARTIKSDDFKEIDSLPQFLKNYIDRYPEKIANLLPILFEHLKGSQGKKILDWLNNNPKLTNYINNSKEWSKKFNQIDDFSVMFKSKQLKEEKSLSNTNNNSFSIGSFFSKPDAKKALEATRFAQEKDKVFKQIFNIYKNIVGGNEYLEGVLNKFNNIKDSKELAKLVKELDKNGWLSNDFRNKPL